jgi:DNA-binding SARP family transcriptional activator
MGLYRINPDVQLTVDVHQFEDALAVAESPSCAPEARRALLAQAVGAYRGPFFPECYADWAGAVRRRLERRYVTALAQLVDATWAAGDYRACLKWCLRLLEEEPAEETVHCRALECYERLGEPLAGILHFRRYTREAGESGAETSVRARTIVNRLQTLVSPAEPGSAAPAYLG